MKPLPHKDDVVATPTRSGGPRLSPVESKALASVADESLRKALGELFISTRASQDNFQKIEEWIPWQPADVNAPAYEGGGVSGIPFKKAVAGLASSGGAWERGGSGASIERTGKGTYRVEYDFEAEGVFVFPQTHGVSADWSVVVGEPSEEAIVVQTYTAKTGEAIDAEFFFTAFEIGKEGNTIVGPEGKEGPTHKTLYHGEGEPPAELGEVDDFYIDTEVWKIYGPKTEEGWGEGVSVVGPQGEKGEPGEPGPAGEKGAEGKEGPAGKEGPKGATGEVGPKGETGAEGRWAGLHYTWLTNTEVSDPGSGKAKRSNTNSALRISETDRDGNSVAAFLAAWDDSTSATKGTIIVRQVGSPKRFRILKITGALTDEGAWDSIPTELIAEGEALENEKEVVIEWLRTGDRGEQGEKGATGEKGSTGEKGATGSEGRSAGLKFLHLTNTEEGDPGFGKLKFNAGKTALFISILDNDGNNANLIEGMWDDFVAETRGYLMVRKVGTPTTFAYYKITGNTTAKVLWNKVSVALLSSSGELGNEDAVGIEFLPASDLEHLAEGSSFIIWRKAGTLEASIVSIERAEENHALEMYTETGGGRSGLCFNNGKTEALRNIKILNGAAPAELLLSNQAGESDFHRLAGATVASANTITVKKGIPLAKITGTTEIKKITATVEGHLLVLKFASNVTVAKGENLKLKENFAATENDTLTLICDGTNWFECARSANP